MNEKWIEILSSEPKRLFKSRSMPRIECVCLHIIHGKVKTNKCINILGINKYKNK